MKREEATAGIAYLVALTTGWTDEAVELYIAEAMNYHDPDAFMKACRNLGTRWKEGRRPFMYDVNVAYQTELRNAEMDRALPIGGTGVIPEFRDGVAIAWEAYQGECRRLGKEPNRTIFEKWLPG